MKKKIRKRFDVKLDNNGHTPYRPFDFPSFTILRDPVGHAVSLYTYIKTHPGMPAHQSVRKLTFAQWIRRKPDRWGRRPGSFTHFLAGGHKKRLEPEKELELAIRHADEIDFIAFTELLNSDMNAVLNRVAKIDARWDGTRHNANQKNRKPRPTPADIALIKNLRAEDYVLIKHVAEKRGITLQFSGKK